MDELKPCPFCKGLNIVRYSYNFSNNIHYQCSKCGCLSIFDNKSKDTWNTRPAEDALKAEVERLKADLEIQKNLTRQACFEAKRAYAETEKWQKMLYDLVDKQAKVSTQINAPDTNVGEMKARGGR